MPVNGTFAALSKRGFGAGTIQSAVSYFMYMYTGGSGTGVLTVNEVGIGSYDYSVSKFASVNALSDQILAIDDTSSIKINGTKSFIYSNYAPTGNNTVLCNIFGSFGIVSLSAYTFKQGGGTLLSTPTLTKYVYDSSGNIITVGIVTISTIKYLVVAKFTNTGTITWQKKFTLPNSTGVFAVSDLCVDSSNDIYMCGQYDSSGSAIGLTGMWVKITSAGALGFMKYEPNMTMTGIRVVSSNIFMAVTSTSTHYENYDYRGVTTGANPYIVTANVTTGSLTNIAWIAQSPNNSYGITGLEINPSDPNTIFVYGFSRTYSAVPSTKIVIFKFDASLSSILSQREITFTSNTVLNPTYTTNCTYIDKISYQPSSNTYWITGCTQDTAGALPSNPMYYNSFFLRAQVDQDYTGTILNRTYSIAPLTDTISLNSVSTFTGTSFASVVSNTTYTLSFSNNTTTSSSTNPTKVNL